MPLSILVFESAAKNPTSNNGPRILPAPLKTGPKTFPNPLAPEPIIFKSRNPFLIGKVAASKVFLRNPNLTNPILLGIIPLIFANPLCKNSIAFGKDNFLAPAFNFAIAVLNFVKNVPTPRGAFDNLLSASIISLLKIGTFGFFKISSACSLLTSTNSRTPFELVTYFDFDASPFDLISFASCFLVSATGSLTAERPADPPLVEGANDLVGCALAALAAC